MNLYSASAPAQHHFFPPSSFDSTGFFPGSPNIASPSFSEVGTPDLSSVASYGAYEYFAGHNHDGGSGYSSPFLGNGSSSFYSMAAPTHVNPSQLLPHQQLQQHAQAAYDSDASSWGISPLSGNDSPRNGTPSPPGGAGTPQPHPSPRHSANVIRKPSVKQRSMHLSGLSEGSSSASRRPSDLSVGGSNLKSCSTPDLVSTGKNTKGKSASAPTSRIHSRSNTLTSPPPLPVMEGKPLTTSPPQSATLDSGSGSGEKPKPVPSTTPAAGSFSTTSPLGADGVEVRCLNCNTTVRPLLLWLQMQNSFFILWIEYPSLEKR